MKKALQVVVLASLILETGMPVALADQQESSTDERGTMKKESTATSLEDGVLSTETANTTETVTSNTEKVVVTDTEASSETNITTNQSTTKVTETEMTEHVPKMKKETESTTESLSSSQTESEEDEADSFQPPMITEDTQHALGHSLKRSRSKRSLRLLNWDDNVLPRTDFIDISSHQGTMTVADFNNLKKYGVTGVVIKLTEFTTYRNPFAASQIANAKKAGMKVSVYHYSWFSTAKSAEVEADYFMAYAKELGVANAVMINDIEEPQIESFDQTKNSVAFANRLKAKGSKKVLHYSSLSWFSNGVLNESKMGGPKSVWIAQYPYEPSKDHLLHTDKSAWQWASDVQFPGDQREFDVNIDYSNVLSQGKQLAEQGPYISHKKYVEITKKGQSIWSNFNWKEKNKTDKLLNKVFFAKGRYEHTNGNTYYSLYDKNDVWQGYIDANATQPSSDQGPVHKFGEYIMISRPNYNIWSDFNWKKKDISSKHHQKTYLAKRLYKHSNGATYYSIYDHRDKWLGYINANATKTGEPQGQYIKHNKYVSISKDSYKIWSNFNWKKKSTSKEKYQQVFLAKGRYQHFNGATYYSLYDKNDVWHGYINANATKTGEPQGQYIKHNKYVSISKDNYKIWSNFNWKKKSTSKEKYQQVFLAKGRYQHFNGATYYSLYDKNDVWQGYINANATKKVK